MPKFLKRTHIYGPKMQQRVRDLEKRVSEICESLSPLAKKATSEIKAKAEAEAQAEAAEKVAEETASAKKATEGEDKKRPIEDAETACAPGPPDGKRTKMMGDELPCKRATPVHETAVRLARVNSAEEKKSKLLRGKAGLARKPSRELAEESIHVLCEGLGIKEGEFLTKKDAIALFQGLIFSLVLTAEQREDAERTGNLHI